MAFYVEALPEWSGAKHAPPPGSAPPPPALPSGLQVAELEEYRVFLYGASSVQVDRRSAGLGRAPVVERAEEQDGTEAVSECVVTGEKESVGDGSVGVPEQAVCNRSAGGGGRI